MKDNKIYVYSFDNLSGNALSYPCKNSFVSVFVLQYNSFVLMAMILCVTI